jgi:hypothetical protein
MHRNLSRGCKQEFAHKHTCLWIIVISVASEIGVAFVESRRSLHAQHGVQIEPLIFALPGIRFERLKQQVRNSFTRCDARTYIRLISPHFGRVFSLRNATHPTGAVSNSANHNPVSFSKYWRANSSRSSRTSTRISS